MKYEAVLMMRVRDESRSLDHLRSSREYKEWVRDWKERLRSHEIVAANYLGRRVYKDA